MAKTVKHIPDPENRTDRIKRSKRREEEILHDLDEKDDE